MVAIRSASKATAGRGNLRLVSGEKTPPAQGNRLGEATPGTGARTRRSRAPKPASDASPAPVILWDDPVGSATDTAGER
jgi:hypothetical protein